MNVTRLVNLKINNKRFNCGSSKGVKGVVGNIVTFCFVSYGIGLVYHVGKNGYKKCDESILNKNDAKTIFFDTCDGVYDGCLIGLKWPKLVYDNYTKE